MKKILIKKQTQMWVALKEDRKRSSGFQLPRLGLRLNIISMYKL